MVKKIIALVFVVGIIASMVGCSGGGDTGPAPAGTNQATQGATAGGGSTTTGGSTTG